MCGDRVVHLALHGLTGCVEGVEGFPGGGGPALREVEWHLPFLQRCALGEVDGGEVEAHGFDPLIPAEAGTQV